jgi:two-component system, cell cycle sensor histidine kinase and response regulator CckA
MRPDPSLSQALRFPLAHNLRVLGALLTQNQLRIWRMAYSEARRIAAPAPGSAARAAGLSAVLAILGLAAVASLAAAAAFIAGSLEVVVLGALALLAVAGVFLVFGLLSGFLRLSEREADFAKAVAGGLDEALLILNRQGSVLYRNAAARRLTDRRTGRQATLEELFAGEGEAAQAFFRLNRAAERGELREEQFHARSIVLGGRVGGWINVSVRPLKPAPASGSDGRLTLWRVSDVTRERSREVETVAGLEATLAFYDGMPQGFFAVGADGRIVHLNATLGQWLGLRPDPARALSLIDIVSADSAALIRSVGRAAQGRVSRLELDLLREDGSAFPVHLLCRAGGARGVIAILVLDRTTERGRERSRGESEARLTRLFKSAPFGIATVDADGAIATANAAFMRMFSDEERSLPATVSALVPDGEDAARGELDKALQRAIAGRTGAAPIEIALGAQHALARRVYVHPLAAGDSERGGAILYAIDVTEQKALELKFAQSHKMEAVGQLAGGVAHDFNNVLTAIIGFSDLLLQTHRPTDPAYRDIMNIKSSANRAAGLVQHLLAFSRRQTLQPEVLELGELLTDLSAFLNRSLGEKVELRILPGRDLWHVKADKTQFEHVVINLAVNARDAMPDGGRLTIRTRNISERDSLRLAERGMAAGEYVQVEVEDTGVGMTQEVLEKIFEPFFTTKDVGKGTGLGLSTVYGIVKQTGGYVFADSKVGKGTAFRVYLPRHIVENEDELPSQRAEKKKETARDLTGTGRVLLVEDEDIVRQVAARALARQGYEVLEAGTGVEALDVVEREKGRVDIVVSDVIMPEMDGPTLLKELRKTKPELKFIFVSGHTDDAFKKSLDENESYVFLPKPFTLPQLAAKVKEQLGR